jgi:hypothetical protein
MPTPEIPMSQVAARPVGLRKKLLLIVPLPVSCFFLARALTLNRIPGGDPTVDLATSMVRTLFFLGAFAAFYVSVRTFLSITRHRGE